MSTGSATPSPSATRGFLPRWALVAGIAIMVPVALLRTAVGTYSLLFFRSATGAIDLLMLKTATEALFAGVPVYEAIGSAVYLPATYVTAWPLVGWGGPGTTRWVWAATSVLLLVWFGRIVVRGSRLEGTGPLLFAWLFLLAVYPTATTLAGGQMTFHVLAPLLGATVMLEDERVGPAGIVAASLLLCVATAKPHLTAPLFAVVVLRSARGAAAVSLTAVWYVVLTWVGALLVDASIPATIRAWASRIEGMAGWVPIYWSLHGLVTDLGHPEWGLPISILVLVLLVVWIAFHRERDPWALLGVAAIVARLWSYHRPYDDLLLVVPMVALVRLAADGRTRRERLAAGVLLFLFWSSLLWPAELAHRFPPLYASALFGAQAAIWLTGLAFLLARDPRRTPPPLAEAGAAP